MNRLAGVTIVTALALAAAPVPAGALGIFGTWWNVEGSDNFGIGAGLRYHRPVTRLVALDLRAGAVDFDSEFSGVYPFEAAALATAGKFYGGFGGGYYLIDGKSAEVDNNPGWFVLAGARITRFFGEVKWTQLSSDGVDRDLTARSYELDGFSLNLGVMLGGIGP